MSTIQLTRAQRREMKKLAERIDAITQGDRRYFERFPGRQHRLRLAGEAERQQRAIALGSRWTPTHHELCVAIRNVAPGVRLRALLTAPEYTDTDISEADAKAIFEAVSTDQTRAIEASLRRAIVEGRV